MICVSLISSAVFAGGYAQVEAIPLVSTEYALICDSDGDGDWDLVFLDDQGDGTVDEVAEVDEIEPNGNNQVYNNYTQIIGHWDLGYTEVDHFTCGGGTDNDYEEQAQDYVDGLLWIPLWFPFF